MPPRHLGSQARPGALELPGDAWPPAFAGHGRCDDVAGQDPTDGSRSTPSSLPPLATRPVNLKEAIWFAGLFLAVKWAVNLAHAWLGNAGIALASALAGLTDMDAITISLADQTSRSEIRMLTIGLLIAALVNTLVKYGLCLALGSQDLRHSTSRAFLAVLVPGFLWLVWVWAGN